MLKKKHKLGRTIGEGIIFLLPILILVVIYKWLYGFLLSFIAPLSFLFFMNTGFGYIALTLLIFLAICYVIGIVIKTKHGRKLLGYANRIFTMLPGYAFLLGLVIRIFRSNASRFSSVVLVDLFGKGTLVTGFITDDCGKGRKTVFVPTGPNPTSGMIYHVKDERIHHVNVSVEDTMRTIISCGHGSKKLVQQLRKKF
ncbi:DUF502 domain-containing protein [Candidatus Woesearchaeota archaeon]|nr:DUF502 domain-containing protein [Candidatus Woesearchaeota archaeon]